MTFVPKPSRSLRKASSSRRWRLRRRVGSSSLGERADGAGPKQTCSGEQPLAQCCLRSGVPPALRRSTRGGCAILRLLQAVHRLSRCTTQEDEQEPSPEAVESSSPYARQRTADRCPGVRISMRRHAVHGISTQTTCTGREPTSQEEASCN